MFTLTSSAFADGDAIGSRYTCDGEDLSPPLAWSDPPEGTATVAVLITDPDARGFVHWLAANLAPGAPLPEGASGSAAAGVEGGNDFGGTGYRGPCPPGGEHRYVIEAFALSGHLDLKPGYSERDLRRRMAPVTLGRASLTTRCRRAR
jgi:Raf kinase inhibitor-like YbhB/YbcL family protein